MSCKGVSTKVFRQSIKFVAGLTTINNTSPKIYIPQIAFIGKSNVGKSSLINSICNRKNLARVSNTPGRTQQINFFSIADKFFLVDLPGYGYARISKEKKKHLDKLTRLYCNCNQYLNHINLLIDSRCGIKSNDIDIMNILNDTGCNFQIILTKVDKERVDKAYIYEIKSLLKALGFSKCDIVITSSKKGIGIKELQHKLIQALV